eukprot:jgi/Mesvir1/10467/Mv14377-RA.1
MLDALGVAEASHFFSVFGDGTSCCSLGAKASPSWYEKKHAKAVASRARSPSPLPKVLHVGNLTRNVNEAHLREIFGNFGKVVKVELAIDRLVNLPKGFGYIEFETRAEAEKALDFMDGVPFAAPWRPTPSPQLAPTQALTRAQEVAPTPRRVTTPTQRGVATSPGPCGARPLARSRAQPFAATPREEPTQAVGRRAAQPQPFATGCQEGHVGILDAKVVKVRAQSWHCCRHYDVFTWDMRIPMYTHVVLQNDELVLLVPVCYRSEAMWMMRHADAETHRPSAWRHRGFWLLGRCLPDTAYDITGVHDTLLLDIETEDLALIERSRTCELQVHILLTE